MKFGSYRLDILVQGYPGKTRRHGGLGWSTVALLRGYGWVAVLDTGGFGMRRFILDRLHALGVAPEAVTDLLLTHLHYDHMINWPLFAGARMVVGARELDWAMGRSSRAASCRATRSWWGRTSHRSRRAPAWVWCWAPH